MPTSKSGSSKSSGVTRNDSRRLGSTPGMDSSPPSPTWKRPTPTRPSSSATSSMARRMLARSLPGGSPVELDPRHPQRVLGGPQRDTAGAVRCLLRQHPDVRDRRPRAAVELARQRHDVVGSHAVPLRRFAVVADGRGAQCDLDPEQAVPRQRVFGEDVRALHAVIASRDPSLGHREHEAGVDRQRVAAGSRAPRTPRARRGAP